MLDQDKNNNLSISVFEEFKNICESVFDIILFYTREIFSTTKKVFISLDRLITSFISSLPPTQPQYHLNNIKAVFPLCETAFIV